jgi:hypothetical protein
MCVTWEEGDTLLCHLLIEKTFQWYNVIFSLPLQTMKKVPLWFLNLWAPESHNPLLVSALYESLWI